MAQAAEIEERLARLDGALRAAEATLDRPVPEDLAPRLDAARGEIERANARLAELEAELAEARGQAEEAAARAAAAEDAARSAANGGEEGVRLRAAVEALTESSRQLRDQQPGAADASLVAEVEALRAARAMDLAEMRALLAELEPMLETTDA